VTLRSRLRMSQSQLYNCGIGLSILLSVGGIWYGAFVSKDCADGERGGALGVASAFLIFFFRRNFGERVYRSILEMNPALAEKIQKLAARIPITTFSNEELTQLLIGILGRINVESDEQRNQNRALFWASVIATLAWGFGDLIVQRIIHTCHCSC